MAIGIGPGRYQGAWSSFSTSLQGQEDPFFFIFNFFNVTVQLNVNILYERASTVQVNVDFPKLVTPHLSI